MHRELLLKKVEKRQIYGLVASRRAHRPFCDNSFERTAMISENAFKISVRYFDPRGQNLTS